MAYNPSDPAAEQNPYAPPAYPNPSGYTAPGDTPIPPAPVPDSALADPNITNEIPAQVNYNQPQPFDPGTPRLLLIGGVALVVIIAALYFLLFANKSGLGTLPPYPGATAITLTDSQRAQTVESIRKRYGGGATSVDSAFYTTTDSPTDVVRFYMQKMTEKKYACTPATSTDYSTLNCQADSDAALVFASRLHGSDLDVAPELNGKISPGQTLLVLVVGTKPSLTATTAPTTP